jgi:hypothetical protein
VHVSGTTIMDRVRMVIRRTVTVTATVRMVIRTIGDQIVESKPTRPSTDSARPLFSH